MRTKVNIWMVEGYFKKRYSLQTFFITCSMQYSDINCIWLPKAWADDIWVPKTFFKLKWNIGSFSYFHIHICSEHSESESVHKLLPGCQRPTSTGRHFGAGKIIIIIITFISARSSLQLPRYQTLSVQYQTVFYAVKMAFACSLSMNRKSLFVMSLASLNWFECHT